MSYVQGCPARSLGYPSHLTGAQGYPSHTLGCLAYPPHAPGYPAQRSRRAGIPTTPGIPIACTGIPCATVAARRDTHSMCWDTHHGEGCTGVPTVCAGMHDAPIACTGIPCVNVARTGVPITHAECAGIPIVPSVACAGIPNARMGRVRLRHILYRTPFTRPLACM